MKILETERMILRTFMENNLDAMTAMNQASRHVMEKIGLKHNPIDDFDHPNLKSDSPLRRHVLYRISSAEYLEEVK